MTFGQRAVISIAGNIALLAGFIIGLALFDAASGCRPSLPPDEPDVVIVATDAAALRDAGPDASPCAVFCAHLAAPEPPCREAIAQCIPACDLALRKGLLADRDVDCVGHASGRAELQTCGRFCR